MDLYSKTILDLNSHPPNFTERKDAHHEMKAYNTYCGDKFKVYLDYEKAACRITFQGNGCAVSKASTAILTESVSGKSWQEIHDLCVTVLDFLSEENRERDKKGTGISNIDTRLEAFAVVRKYPGRYECAALCWVEMRKYALNELTKLG